MVLASFVDCRLAGVSFYLRISSEGEEDAWVVERASIVPDDYLSACKAARQHRYKGMLSNYTV